MKVRFAIDIVQMTLSYVRYGKYNIINHAILNTIFHVVIWTFLFIIIKKQTINSTLHLATKLKRNF